MNYVEAHRPISLLAPPMLYGTVLQLGLGIGWMSDKILTHGITELTTWENDEEVIAARGETDPRHTIRLGDALDAFDIVRENGVIKSATVKPNIAAEYDFIYCDVPDLPNGWLKTGLFTTERFL